jgi:hypothetical protein
MAKSAEEAVAQARAKALKEQIPERMPPIGVTAAGS